MNNTPLQNSQLIDKIFSTQALLEKVGNEVIFKKFHITTSLYGTLKMIDSGLSSISEMKKYTTETASSLTQKINKLEQLNFIDKTHHPIDKRKWNLSVTKKGKSIIKKIDTESNQHSCMFEKFTTTEKKIFYKILHDLETQLINNIKKYHEK